MLHDRFFSSRISRAPLHYELGITSVNASNDGDCHPESCKKSFIAKNLNRSPP